MSYVILKSKVCCSSRMRAPIDRSVKTENYNIRPDLLTILVYCFRPLFSDLLYIYCQVTDDALDDLLGQLFPVEKEYAARFK